MLNIDIHQILLSIAVAAAGSLLGVFVILRKMALVSDVLSHVALPGIAIALMLNINPFIGAFFALVIAISFIVVIEKKYQFSIEALVGVFFTASLALGILLMGSDPGSIAEALFGDISKINMTDFWQGMILGAAVFLATAFFFRKFAQVTFSRELAQSQGANTGAIDYLFLLLLAVVIGLGIKIIGILLMGALVILPALIAKNFSRGLKMMALFAIIVSASIVFFGFLVGAYFNVAKSAVIILLGTVLFVLSLLFNKK